MINREREMMMGQRSTLTPQRDAMTNTAELVMPRYTSREKVVTMIGVLLVMLLASLDSTIVSTAMPRIIADLQGFDRYAWVSTAYMLTSTVGVPIYGKLSDQVGRKPILLFGIILFLVGSALSGLSQTMNQMIGFRALQGLGAGSLMSLAPTVVGDLFTPRERGKWQGVTGAVFGISSIVGPLIGGWLTEYASWHWIFYVNIPIGLIALLVLILTMPALRTGAARASVDYQGAALLIIGTVPLLLAFSWGGSQYPWFSLPIIGLLVFALAVLIGFTFYESRLSERGGEPILAPGLFRNRIFTISTIITTVISMALYGSVFFIPLFVQGVIGQSATNSGLLITPMMLSSVVTSILAGQLVSRLGHYKWIAITGLVVSLGGEVLLVLLNAGSNAGQVTLAMIVLGAGLGFGMSLYTLIVQNAMPARIGQATSTLIFFRSIGGTLILGLMGSILNSAYLPAFQQALPSSIRQKVPEQVLRTFNDPQVLLAPDTMARLQAQFASYGAQGPAMLQQIIEAMKVGLVRGIHEGFVIGLILMALGLLMVFFLPEIPLRGSTRNNNEV
jgi:EmrB/QacA subfamily drug resistance transporter